MSGRGGVVVVGSSNTDMIVRVPKQNHGAFLWKTSARVK